MKINDFMDARILFVINHCSHCRLYREFIERVNLKLPLNKQISIIDCTRYYDLGIIDNPLIKKFDKYIKGNFPLLFYAGMKLEGGNSREELESFITSLVYKDYIVSEEIPYQFNKECVVVQKGIFKKSLVCN